jgi:hypothetical protein
MRNSVSLTELKQIDMEGTTNPTRHPQGTPSMSKKGHPRQRRATADGQTDRKRELDRIAQRMSRERLRNHIMFLEQKLKSLEACDRHGQITHLMNVIKELQQSNTQLRASMIKIRSITDNSSVPVKKCTHR